MYHILVYPNITYQRNLEKDSYVVVLSNVIKELNNIRDDLKFTIISPSFIKSLKFINTNQVILPLPTYPNQMRTHFDSTKILNLIDWKNRSYDIVWSHLPEHTLQLKNLFYNMTNEVPVFIGYSHWFEVPENTYYRKTMLTANLFGILEMEKCMVNSEWLKDLIIRRSQKILSKDLVKQLQEKIIIGYLGSDEHNIKPRKPNEKILVFNHRDNKYTGFREVVAILDKLWEERKDFSLLTTLVTLRRPYTKTVNITDRTEYLNELSKCYAGIGYFKNYSAWSISTTDGLSVGVPYLLPNGYCYPEMVGNEYPLLFNNKKQFIKKLNFILNNKSFRDRVSREVYEKSKTFTWKKRIDSFNDLINQAIFKLPILKKRTEVYYKMANFIRKDPNITKKELCKKMNWGLHISWNGYKNMLRKDNLEIKNG